MKYKLLIVDDEQNIRLGIQAMVKRGYQDVFDILLAGDGVEASDILKDHYIDILITDIKMPRMNGIQLIQGIQDMADKPSLLILSGYDDFEFAREAIKCRVSDYLLKPINRNELFSSLDKVLNEIQTKQADTNHQFDDYLDSQFNYIFMHPSITEEEVEEICKKLNLHEYEHGYYVGVVRQNKGISDGESLIRIKNLIEKESQNHQHGKTISFYDKDENIVFLTPSKGIIDTVVQYFEIQRHANYHFGISAKTEWLSQLKKAYLQAKNAQKYHLLYSREAVTEFEKVQNLRHDYEIPLEDIKKIFNMIGTERKEEIKKLIQGVLNYDKLSGYSIDCLEQITGKINTIIFEGYLDKLGEDTEDMKNQFLKVKDLYNFNSFSEFYHFIESLIIGLHEYIYQIKSVYSEQKYMEDALQYIKDNYHRDLNLAVVSNFISLNYSYFSHIFKEYTGMSFVNYLKRVRIEEAKKLLNQTNYKVFEVGEMVGFKNPKQFAKAFKEVEGISPTEYRGILV